LRTSRERLHGSGSDTARREDSPGVEGTRRAGVGPRRVALPRAACVRALELLARQLGWFGLEKDGEELAAGGLWSLTRCTWTPHQPPPLR
jgi:hypothetical protein